MQERKGGLNGEKKKYLGKMNGGHVEWFLYAVGHAKKESGQPQLLSSPESFL